MELKEGMYVRFKDKRNIEYIRQIVKIPEDKRFASIYLDKEANYSNGLSFKNVIKAGYSTMDLIKVGDYVNGLPVTRICVDEETNEKYLNMYGSISEWTNQDIESIVTKEEFKNSCYEVGVNNVKKEKYTI